MAVKVLIKMFLLGLVLIITPGVLTAEMVPYNATVLSGSKCILPASSAYSLQGVGTVGALSADFSSKQQQPMAVTTSAAASISKASLANACFFTQAELDEINLGSNVDELNKVHIVYAPQQVLIPTIDVNQHDLFVFAEHQDCNITLAWNQLLEKRPTFAVGALPQDFIDGCDVLACNIMNQFNTVADYVNAIDRSGICLHLCRMISNQIFGKDDPLLINQALQDIFVDAAAKKHPIMIMTKVPGINMVLKELVEPSRGELIRGVGRLMARWFDRKTITERLQQGDKSVFDLPNITMNFRVVEPGRLMIKTYKSSSDYRTDRIFPYHSNFFDLGYLVIQAKLLELVAVVAEKKQYDYVELELLYDLPTKTISIVDVQLSPACSVSFQKATDTSLSDEESLTSAANQEKQTTVGELKQDAYDICHKLDGRILVCCNVTVERVACEAQHPETGDIVKAGFDVTRPRAGTCAKIFELGLAPSSDPLSPDVLHCRYNTQKDDVDCSASCSVSTLPVYPRCGLLAPNATLVQVLQEYQSTSVYRRAFEKPEVRTLGDLFSCECISSPLAVLNEWISNLVSPPKQSFEVELCRCPYPNMFKLEQKILSTSTKKIGIDEWFIFHGIPLFLVLHELGHMHLHDAQAKMIKQWRQLVDDATSNIGKELSKFTHDPAASITLPSLEAVCQGLVPFNIESHADIFGIMALDPQEDILPRLDEAVDALFAMKQAMLKLNFVAEKMLTLKTMLDFKQHGIKYWQGQTIAGNIQDLLTRAGPAIYYTFQERTKRLFEVAAQKEALFKYLAEQVRSRGERVDAATRK